MKEFLSNSWVISIISGIIVFFLTNFFINIKNRSKYKKQIHDANIMILNHLRGYVVDNDLPKQEIIEAVKNSIAREYNVKCINLLSTKEICEELVKDIIGNIYISNNNKKTYIDMLGNYLEQNKDINIEDANKNTCDDMYNKAPHRHLTNIIAIMSGLITILGTSLFSVIEKTSNDIFDINNIIAILAVIIIGSVILIYIAIKEK